MSLKIGKDCMELMNKKLSKEITPDEYYIGIMELHNKYPFKCQPNFYDAAQIYAMSIRKMEKQKTERVNPAKQERKERLPYAEDDF